MTTAIVTVLMFLIMISLHEFGHFITGKLLGFKVLEYAIGFGPAIFTVRGKETLYSLRVFPLGGYCKFEGEDTQSNDSRAFSNRPSWQRFIVLASGGLCNIILGFILFIIIIPQTSPFATNRVNDVVEGSYIQQAGLTKGDRIIEIDGKNIGSYNDISLYMQDLDENSEVSLTVRRDKEDIKLDFKPTKNDIVYKYEQDGITVTNIINSDTVSEQFYQYSDDMPKDEAKVGTTETVNRLIIGFVPQQEDVTIFNIWGEAYNQTKFVVKLVYRSLWDMITGKVGVEQMSGPVGVVSEVNNAVNSGSGRWLYILNLTALLTINLGLFNLLPIPALDGGRLLFLIPEIITRKKIPPEKEGVVHTIGLMLILALAVYISFNDIMKLING